MKRQTTKRRARANTARQTTVRASHLLGTLAIEITAEPETASEHSDDCAVVKIEKPLQGIHPTKRTVAFLRIEGATLQNVGSGESGRLNMHAFEIAVEELELLYQAFARAMGQARATGVLPSQEVTP